MKTKPFLLATAGSTVDGRTIDDKMLQEMANSYDPKTYGARLNIEHIRGVSGQAPFRAYGDVLELSTATVDVNFNGKTEQRLGLYGVLDVTDDAKALNDAGQKVYPSIEIEPNFAGKGYAYLMGAALTDSPASIATDRLQFNRQLPGAIALTADKCGIQAASIEPADEETATAEAAGAVKGFFAKLTEMLSGGAQQQPTKPEPKPETPNAPDLTAFATEFAKLGDVFASALETQANGFKAQIDRLSSDLAGLKQTVEAKTDPNFRTRPPANGGAGNYAGIF